MIEEPDFYAQRYGTCLDSVALWGALGSLRLPVLHWAVGFRLGWGCA